MRRAVLAACLAAAAAAADPQPAAGPGRSVPATAAPAAAWRIDWAGENRSWIVVAPGFGRVQPAWVATYEVAGDTESYQVAYPALAWRDADGVIHIAAPAARVVGPRAFDEGGQRRWWPDSFAIHPDGRVEAQDNQPDAPINPGRVIETVDPAADPAAWRARRNEVAAQAGNQG
ncbi:MAG: hypothetical protein RLZZ127_1536 [Planctomycetota bacterium]|jgi:hypothetical protein